MSKPKITFPRSQSYLISGFDDKAREEELLKLAQIYGLSLQNASPDLFFIESQTPYISIEEIRNLKKHIYQKPLKENFKLIIIKQAEKLTLEAQNAFLKILEEPPNSAIIVLETKNNQRLLKTILSRVTTVNVFRKRKKPRAKSHNLDFETIFEIQNPALFLEEQMLANHAELVEALFRKDTKTAQVKIQKLEEFAEAKKMIEANVNAKFVLANLVLKNFL